MPEPKPLWIPNEIFRKESNLYSYLTWLNSNKGLRFSGYEELWKWSITDIPGFWESIWEYFHLISYSPSKETISGEMPSVNWFKGATLNYSEHIFRQANDKYPAIIFKTEGTSLQQISWQELAVQVGSLRRFLIQLGIKKGDRVAAWISNIPEAVISFLAVNSLGAIWSSTSPDFGISSVVDRFAQIEPKVLITIDAYQYNGKRYDKREDILQIRKCLPSIEHVVVVPMAPGYNVDTQENTHYWDEVLVTPGKLAFEPVHFEHPMWVLYSSGTTGLPKAITHSHGGILLEHLKYLTFHNDVKPGEKFFWYTTTGWMMWNYLVASTLGGATIVLYDGSPAYPDISCLWAYAEEVKINHFGTSAPFIIANMKAGTKPGDDYNLDSLRSISSTGAPLPPNGFEWIYENVKKDLWLASMSGGTDVCSAFVGGNPLLPVFSGEIQCRALGCKLESYDEGGMPVIDEVGEMVISEPMPSMPIYFWNDSDFERYKESYFAMFPAKWRHGDWIRITQRSGVVIYGRSDATLNRGGIRIGTAEIYRVLDKMVSIDDAIIVCVDKENGQFFMPLFIVLTKGQSLDETLKKSIKDRIRKDCSPRHVPDEIVQVHEIPYTISGKKTEAPVKKVLMGQDVSKSLNLDALRNPQSLDFFIDYARKLQDQ